MVNVPVFLFDGLTIQIYYNGASGALQNCEEELQGFRGAFEREGALIGSLETAIDSLNTVS